MISATGDARAAGAVGSGVFRRAPRVPRQRFRPALVLAAILLALSVPALAFPATARAEGASDEGVTVSAEGTPFALTGFTRYNSGAARPVEGVDIGYRFPASTEAPIAVVRASVAVVVHVDADAAAAAGFELGDAEAEDALRALVERADEEASRGGELLSGTGADPWIFTSDDVVELGAYRYRFGVEVAGRSYTAVEPAGLPEGASPTAWAEEAGLDLSVGALWSDAASIAPASDVALGAGATWLEDAASFFRDLDYRPFWVSVKTSACALVVTFVLGLVAAWRTMGTSSRLKGLLDSVFTIPMVLPPTVCGFLLLLLFGQSTPVGRWFIDHGLSLVFSWPAAVISAVVVSFPLMYRTALGAFESLDAAMLDAARTLGWSERRIFARLMLPLAWPSIAAGTVLAFARAMGEFGCTLFFAGNYAGVTQTIPIAIYFEWMGGSTDVALFWVVVVILFSFIVVLFINVYTARSLAYRSRGGGARGRGRARGAAVEASDMVDQIGGDAVRIDRDALRDLVGERGGAGDGGGAR